MHLELSNYSAGSRDGCRCRPSSSIPPSSPGTSRRVVPLLPFDAIPLELTDLRLMVRQTADVLRRFGATRRQRLPARAGVRARHETAGSGRHLVSQRRRARGDRTGHSGTGRRDQCRRGERRDVRRCSPSRCGRSSRAAPRFCNSARISPSGPTHTARCAAAPPSFAVITPAAERHLICGRCALRWKFESLTCPFCLNSDRSRITVIRRPPWRRRLSRLCVRRLPSLSEGVRRTPRHASRSCPLSMASRRCRSMRRRYRGDIDELIQNAEFKNAECSKFVDSCTVTKG